MSLKTEWAADTNVGAVREHNEDAFFVDEALGVGFVADGMGGHEAGEVASAVAVETVRQQMGQGATLSEALQMAHKAILAHPQGGGRRGMGTTGVGFKVVGQQVEVAWVGDSRAYLYDGDKLYPLSKDQTPVQEMVDGGYLTVAQARTHPRRNEITQALGIGSQKVQPGTSRAYFGKGSVILLCSDGLTEHLDDQRILAILASGTRFLDKTVERLITEAVKEGGSDNITVVLAKAVG